MKKTHKLGNNWLVTFADDGSMSIFNNVINENLHIPKASVETLKQILKVS